MCGDLVEHSVRGWSRRVGERLPGLPVAERLAAVSRLTTTSRVWRGEIYVTVAGSHLG